jgi:tripartite-type tricarboxylate transporter receptor subunit TctC
MVLPFAAGGTTDTLVRIIAARMQVLVGQPVIIENVSGAAGTINLGRAAPRRIYNYCGALADAIYKLPFDLLIFEPVVLLANNPSVIVSKKSLRPTSIASIATSARHRAACAAATSHLRAEVSALSKADMCSAQAHVHFGPIADMSWLKGLRRRQRCGLLQLQCPR